MNATRRQDAYASVERVTELPMLALSLVMIPLLVIPLAIDLSPRWEDAFFAADWAIWATFALELAVKVYLAPSRGRYVLNHWFDVLIVALPFLRPLRIVRSARALRALRALRVGAFLSRSTHSVRTLLDSHGLKYVLVVGLALLIASAGLVSLLEKDGEGTIKDFDDALWWAATTVTTVGYGDKFPVTTEGRGVAVFLMLLGISLFSVLTANVAALLVKPRDGGVSLEDVLAELKRLEAKVDELQGRNP